MGTVEERVARGARWLDDTQPDWFKNLRDHRELDARAMETCTDCVAGRIFGNYMRLELAGVKVYNTDFDENAAAYGFTCDWSKYEGLSGRAQSDPEFHALAVAWNAEIDRRLEMASDGTL